MYQKFPTNLSNPVQADSTQHWTDSTTQRLKPAALASAEVIAEAPSSRSGVLPLADFGSVSFANATANGVSLAALNPDPISMLSGSTTKAQPGNISSNGSFSVTWKHS